MIAKQRGQVTRRASEVTNAGFLPPLPHSVPSRPLFRCIRNRFFFISFAAIDLAKTSIPLCPIFTALTGTIWTRAKRFYSARPIATGERARARQPIVTVSVRQRQRQFSLAPWPRSPRTTFSLTPPFPPPSRCPCPPSLPSLPPLLPPAAASRQHSSSAWQLPAC